MAANYLASIHGTELDKVNCAFYDRTGACRHGEKCSRKHNKPNYSVTIQCPNMFLPYIDSDYEQMSASDKNARFNNFYEDLFCEAALFGEVEDIIISENTNVHLMGNVYIRFKYEHVAEKARESFNKRWYDNLPVYCELSPVSDFHRACCKEHDTSTCARGSNLCNYIHRKRPSEKLETELRRSQRKYRLLQGSHSDSESS